MSYEFTTLTDAPVENKGLSFTFGGMNLTEEIENFEVLNVSGRELLNDEIQNTTRAEKDGAVITAQSLPPRTLTIQYRIMANSDEECREAFNQLNYLLRKNWREDKAIVFSDEPDKTFYGRYSQAEDAPANQNKFVSTFTFFCSDPNKYKNEVKYTGNPSILIPDGYLYAIKPSKLKITVPQAVTKVVFTNQSTGRKIVLNGTYGANTTIEILINDNKVLVNGQNRMQDLDFATSDFHKFLVESGQRIGVTPSGPIEITLRSRWL